MDENKNITLYDPFTLKEIILHYGTPEWIKFMSHAFNRQLIRMGERNKAAYNLKQIEVAEFISKALKTKYETVLPAGYTSDPTRPLQLMISFWDGIDPDIPESITIQISYYPKRKRQVDEK